MRRKAGEPLVNHWVTGVMLKGLQKYCLLMALLAVPASQGAAMSPLKGSAVPEGYLEPFMTFFDALALTEDYGPFNSRPPWIRKWTGPVSVVLEGRARTLRPTIVPMLRRISAWTGLRFSISVNKGYARKVKQSNVIRIRLVSPDEIAKAFTADDIVCQTETHGLGGALHTGIMKIREDFTDCLPHEFMHALGFDAHWDPDRSSPIRSVLAYRDSGWRTADFSSWDILAITLLYDWRLRAGMGRGTGLKLVRSLVDREAQQSASLPAIHDTASDAEHPSSNERNTRIQTDRPREHN